MEQKHSLFATLKTLRGLSVKDIEFNRWFLLLDLALFVSTILLLVTPAKVLFFHLVFILLTFGAFYWKFRAFALRAVFWVTITTIIVLLAIFARQTQVEEIIEIPMLTSVLILVFAMAEQRAAAEERLKKANAELEQRVAARTVDLTREIAQRRQTEITLRESEERYRRLVELSFEAVTIHGEGKWLYLNQAAVQLFGARDISALIDEPVLNFVHPDYHGLVQKQMKQATGTGSGAPLVEEKFIRCDGNAIDVEVAAVPITYLGQPAIQAVIRDISPRKQAEAEREWLLATEREQRLLAETLGDVFLALTAQISRHPVLDEILRQAQRVVSYSAANIVLLHRHTLHIVRHQGYEAFSNSATLANLEQSLADFPLDARVVASRQPLVIPDTSQTAQWVTMPETAWIKSSIAVPISLGDSILGLLRLDSDAIGHFSPADVNRLMPLANAAAIALENARLHDQARQEIAERIQAERELRQIAAKNQALLDVIPDSMFHLSRTGRLLDYRIQNSTIFQGDDKTPLAPTLPSLLDNNPELVNLFLNNINQTLDTGFMQIFEYQIPDKLSIFEARCVVNGPNEVLVIVSDISERKAREAALAAERARIARDLHDSLGQNLGFLRLKLDEFTYEELPQPSALRQELVQMRDVTNEAYELVRSMIAAARPANTTDFATALLAQSKSIGSRARFKIRMTGVGLPQPISPVVQQQALYICREALINVARHAKAKRVELHLAWEPDALTLTITDDGCGFDASALPHNDHYGLSIMQERATEINGSLEISSNPNQGTCLTLRLSLTHNLRLHAVSHTKM